MTQPLQGVRIVDLTQVLAGPFATRQLADLGAEVIKIEQPGAGDPTRSWGPHFLNGHSAYFLGINRNKKSVTLNLRHPKGQEVLHKLVATSDAVVDNYRPATARRLGITHEALRAFNPRIITCSLSGFGDAPGYENKPAFDSIVQAMGGAMSVTGEPGGAPAVMGFPLGDLGGGLALSQAVLAALYARSQTGQAQRAELSMLDMQVQFQAHLGQFHLVSGEEPGPIGNSHPHNAPVRAFLCRDGRYIQVHCPTDPSYRALATALDEELGGEFASLASDPRFSSPGGTQQAQGPALRPTGAGVHRKRLVRVAAGAGRQEALPRPASTRSAKPSPSRPSKRGTWWWKPFIRKRERIALRATRSSSRGRRTGSTRRRCWGNTHKKSWARSATPRTPSTLCGLKAWSRAAPASLARPRSSPLKPARPAGQCSDPS